MAGIQLELTEGQINNAIAVALAESLTPERQQALIRDVVRAHLAAKSTTYGRETILSAAVGAQVKEIAGERMKAAVEAMRPEIEAQVDKHLGPTFRESVLASLKTALEGRLRFGGLDISARWDED